MASTRHVAGSVPVGSLAWVANERATIEQLETQELEEFAFAARNDLEWLNEHMADIFERNTFDMAELMKTPGKLRGVPRTVRKKADAGREALTDVFEANRSPEAPESRFTQALTQLANPANDPIPASESPSPRSPAKALMGPPPVPNSPPKMQLYHNDPAEEQVSSKPANFMDSGFFSASQPNSQMDIQEPSFTRAYKRPSNSSQVSYDARAESESKEPTGRKTRSSAAAAKETEDVPAPEPMEIEEADDIQEASAPEPGHIAAPLHPEHRSPVKPPSSPKKSAPVQRRSGRIAGRTSTDQSAGGEPPMAEEQVAEPIPIAAESLAASQAPEGMEDAMELEPTQMDTSEDEKSSSSRSPTPEVNIVRKSSMNFAPLPAREPLTSKRPIPGRDSHLENMRQPNTARASWLNKKSNGKSLGGSARPIIPRDVGGGEEAHSMAEEKRTTEEYVPRHMREERTNDEVLVQETKETVRIPTKTGEEDDSEDERRRHTKANTKRLHDKIQQLGKLSVARPKSNASADEDPRYPSLPGMDMDVDQESPVAAPLKTPMEFTRSAYESTTQPPTAAPSERYDTTGNRPHIPRSRTEDPGRTQDPFAIGNSPVMRPSPSRTDTYAGYPNVPSRDPLKSPIYNSPSRTREVEDRSISPTSSPFRNATSSPLKKNVSIYDMPQHSTDVAPESPSKQLFANEGSYSQSKGSMATYLAKAKQLLARSGGAAVNARAEAASPLSKDYDDGGDVFRSEAAASHARDQSETPRRGYDEPGYPTLESVARDPVPLPETRSSRAGSIRNADRPLRNSRSKPETTSYDRLPTRQTRSSRSHGELGSEMVTPYRSPARSKRDEEAAIRAAEEEQRRRDQEQLLREKELLKRIQKEERRLAAAEEEKRRQIQAAAEEEKRRQQLRAEEEERRQQLRAEEEERRRQEAEEEEWRRQQAEEEEAALQMAAAEAQAQAAQEMEIERSESTRSQRERMGSVDQDRPQSRIQKTGSIRFRPSENKPPIRAKSQTKMRPAPVTIKIGTTSQMDQRRKDAVLGHAPTSSVAALKSAFEPPQRPDSRQTLQNASSQGSIRSVNSASGTTKSVKSLQAAANARQREQEEKERRELQRKDSERRRQEKKRQEEEQRKLEEQRKMEEQRRQQRSRANTAPSAPKTLNRVPQIHNLRQPSQEPEQHSQPSQSSSKYGKLAYAKGGSIKRVMPVESDELLSARAVPSRPGFPAFHQEGTKKRRTNDFEDIEYQQPQQPQQSQQHKQPIRPSAVKNQLPQRGMPTHGYKSVNTLSSGQTIKAVGPTGGAGRQIPHVDGVKYTAEKIHFAGETGQKEHREPRPGPAAPSAHFKTPVVSKSSKHKSRSKTPVAESPLYPNADEVELPPILTDSEDEDEDYANLPRWVESPYLRELLENQQDVDPAEIFGEVKPPDMEAMFKGSLDERRAARLRVRTSSAHWGGPDGLTQEEMLRDLEERRKLHAQGHWTYPAGL